jgi:hypothetical protein
MKYKEEGMRKGPDRRSREKQWRGLRKKGGWVEHKGGFVKVI